LFITFEGIEGSGKTTQIKLLLKAMKKQGIACLATREPGGTKIGQQIRAILLDPKNRKMDSRTELLLYLADRCQHLAEKIQPALDNGQWVVSDRFWDASVVYQVIARGLDGKLLARLRPWILGELRPDRTFLLDLPAASGLARAWERINGSIKAGRESRFEKEDLEFHEKIRQGYLKLARREPDRIKVINAALPTSEIHRLILDIIFKPR
jgi:dTMP kinase